MDTVDEERALSRLVTKDGKLSLKYSQLSWGNPFQTDHAISLRWCPLFQFVIIGFLLNWSAFAFIYLFVEYSNGTLDYCDGDESLENLTTCNDTRVKTKCITGVVDFNSALLFSVETATTIGYGSRALTDQCHFTILMASIQSMIGLILTGLLTGLIMAKFSMPGKRKESIIFSRRAAVLKRGDFKYLVVKVADTRNNKLKGVTTKALLVSKSASEEGEVRSFNIAAVQFGVDSFSNNLPFMWPICIAHLIDDDSPFKADSLEDLLQRDFEIILWLSGTTSSGGVVTARTSFLPSDIVHLKSFNFHEVFRVRPSHITIRVNEDTFNQIDWPTDNEDSEPEPAVLI